MTQPYDGQDRRTPPPAQDHGWHLDKKVPLSLIFAMLMQAAMVIWAIADIKKDVELVKADLIVLHQRDKAQTENLKDAINALQAYYSRMDAKLDRLIERNNR
jgi:hypothetical protein